jgi:hypothetical protein
MTSGRNRSVFWNGRFPVAISVAVLLAVAAVSEAVTTPGFYTVTPCRVVDTRNPAGPWGGPALQANSDRSFVVAGKCGIPSTAEVVTLNVTVTQATAGGDLRLYPGGASLPMATAINYGAGKTRANNGTLALGPNGDLLVHCDQSSGSVHMILDVSGYLETTIPVGGGGGAVWTKWYGGSGEDDGKAVAVDSSGNVAVAGNYQGIVDFGVGSMTSYTMPGNGPTADAFVARYTSSGAVSWARGMGGDNSDAAMGVAMGSSGDVVVTGYQLSTSADYGGGLLGNRGGSDMFLAKYAGASGGYLWAKTIGGTGYDSGTSVAVDSGANVYVTGYFDLSVDFGGGALSSAGGRDAFLVKYSSAGAHLWSKRFGSTGQDSGSSVAVDSSGNVFVAGTFTGSINLGGTTLTSAGGADIFVAKFSATGQHLWSKAFGGTSTDAVRGIAVDGAGDVVLTGQFLNTINFGGPALTSAGFEDIFLAKLSGAAGAHLWSKRFGSDSTTDAGYGVAVDSTGNVAMTGYYGPSADFGGGIIIAQAYDIFVAKYSSTGGYISARRYGDPPGNYDGQFGNAIAMSGGGSIYITGHFVGTLTFGAGGQKTSTQFGGNDAFLASIGP